MTLSPEILNSQFEKVQDLQNAIKQGMPVFTLVYGCTCNKTHGKAVRASLPQRHDGLMGQVQTHVSVLCAELSTTLQIYGPLAQKNTILR